MKSADVIVIGCGVIGASVAYHLAQRGRTVLVLERGAAPGEGSTSRATGGYRAQFGSEINVRLSLLSRAKLLTFRDETGVDSGYEPRGYLFLAADCSELSSLAAANALQRRLGLNEAEIIATAEAARINPHIDVNGVVGAAFCPSDGFIKPLEILRGYFEAARRLGVEFVFNVRDARPHIERQRITKLSTEQDSWSAREYVNAAGAWAAEFAAACGVSLPITPLKRHVLPTVATAAIGPLAPMTIWVGDGFHFRYRDGRVLLLRKHEPVMKSRYDVEMDDGWIEATAAIARERVPPLRGVAMDRDAAWSGLYEMSPDHHAIVGRSDVIENLFLANGSSGHGVMHAPAIGQLLAEAMCGQTTAISLHPLRATRFEERDPVAGSSIL